MADSGWTVTRGQVEQYQLRGPYGAWAIITLDPRGIFQAVSDFGTYSYDGWGHHGCASFKHFLVRLREADYFISKVCGMDGGRSGPGRAGTVFSWERTIERIRRDVLERRRDGRLDRSAARECWDDIEQIEHSSDSTYFVMSVERDCPDLFKRVFDHDYYALSQTCVHELAPLPLRFFNEVFRGQLVPVLEAELAAAATPAEVVHG